MDSLVHAMLSNALVATVLAVFVAGLGRACRRPALIHGLWLVVMLKLVTPPFVPVFLPVVGDILPASTFTAEVDGDRGLGPDAPLGSPLDPEQITTDEPQFADIVSVETSGVADVDAADSTSITGAETLTQAPSLQPNILLLLLVGWKWEHVVLLLILSGALAWWALAALRIISFQRLLRDLRPVSSEWQSRVDELAARLALDRSPEVCLVPGRVPPMLWAIGSRPRLLLPSKLWSVMSADQRTSLLLHELAHLKRRDHWVRWLELIVGGLYWWHPAVWWIRRSLREAEEQCCDAWVIWAMPKGAKTYATALLTALEFVSGARSAPATASATSGSRHVSSLKRRLRMIVRAKTPKGLSWAGYLAVLGTAALLLPLAPTWAQKSEPDRSSIGLELLDDVDFSDVVLNAQDRDQAKPPVTRGDNAAVNGQLADQVDEQLEIRIREEFGKDPEVIALTDAISETRKERDHSESVARQENDPSRRVTEKECKRLEAEYQLLWAAKYKEIRKRLTASADGALSRIDQGGIFKGLTENQTQRMVQEMVKTDLELAEAEAALKVFEQADAKDDNAAREFDLRGYLARLYQDDRKDDAKDDKVRDTAERFEQQVKDLIGKIGKELGPLGDEVRKALEKSVDDLHRALEKENASVDDVRKSLEKSYEDMRQTFTRRGGPVDKDVREAWERSRGELRQEWLKSREAMRQELRDRVESARRRQGEFRKEPRAGRDLAKAEPDKGDDAKSQERPAQDELDNARKEVRELQQQLNRATRRLVELQQRRGSQRDGAPRGSGSASAKPAPTPDRGPLAKPTPDRGPLAKPTPDGSPSAKPVPERDSNEPNVRRERGARLPRSPGAARTPATPRQVAPPNERKPAAPGRDPAASGRDSAGPSRNPEYDRRFRELDNKLDRLLKELEKLRGEPTPKDSKDPNPRGGRPAKPTITNA